MNTLRDVLEQDRVVDLGPLPAPRLSPHSTVRQGLQFLSRGRRGAIVVVEGLVPVGVLTERDVAHRLPDELLASPEAQAKTAVKEVMSRPAVTVRRQATLAAAIDTMVRNSCRHLVVVDRDGKLRGLLTTNDIVQFLTDQFPEQTLNLPPRLHQSYSTREGA